jgi:hypothetical protein
MNINYNIKKFFVIQCFSNVVNNGVTVIIETVQCF